MLFLFLNKPTTSDGRKKQRVEIATLSVTSYFSMANLLTQSLYFGVESNIVYHRRTCFLISCSVWHLFYTENTNGIKQCQYVLGLNKTTRITSLTVHVINKFRNLSEDQFVLDKNLTK